MEGEKLIHIRCEVLYEDWHVKDFHVSNTVKSTTCGMGRATCVLYRRDNYYQANTGGNLENAV